MKRLTEHDEQGNWMLKDVPWKKLYAGQMITRDIQEKLYGALWKLKDYEDTGLLPEEVEELMLFAKNLPALKTAVPAGIQMQGWIPVTERLPENPDVYVLVQVCGKPHKNITLDNAQMLGQYDDTDGWILEMYPEWKDTGNGVIAWMPLPEPYQE